MSTDKARQRVTNVDVLLTKILQEKHCAQATRDLEACFSAYVPKEMQDLNNIDASLQQKILKNCEPKREVLTRCMQTQSNQEDVMREASRHEQCEQERTDLMKCQEKMGGKMEDCEKQFFGLLECGMSKILEGLYAKMMK